MDKGRVERYRERARERERATVRERERERESEREREKKKKKKKRERERPCAGPPAPSTGSLPPPAHWRRAGQADRSLLA